LSRTYTGTEFERAFASFQELYQVRPHRVLCSPDVLARFCVLFERTPDAAHQRDLRFLGVPLRASILPPGIIAMEGEVDEDRMGDW
jgi:hypothetical protein